MKFVLKSLLLLAAVILATAAVTEKYPSWEEYKNEYRKFYSNPSEDALRKAIYEKNLEIIMDHNRKFYAGLVSYSMGVNKFADWTKEELNSLRGLKVNLTVNFVDENNYPTWEEYKKSFNKYYSNPAEEIFRKNIYEKNLKSIMEHNAKYAKGETTYTMGVNQFSDWTKEEFHHMLRYGVNAVVLTDEKYRTWEEYKNKFGKSYPDPAEDAFRKNLYMKNLKMVIEHNNLYKAGKVTWTMELNKFSDLTTDEIKKMLGFRSTNLVKNEYPSWEEYKKLYGKNYPNPQEDAKRKELYEKTLKTVIEHNKKYAAGEVTWEMGINNFADWTLEEEKHLMGVSQTSLTKSKYPTWEESLTKM